MSVSFAAGFSPPESNLCPITDLGQREDQAERSLTTAKGEHLPILKTVVPILREEKWFLLESFVDLSEQREAEKALSQINARLQETVAEMMIKNSDLGLLRNLNELFQVCRFPDEAYPIIAQFMQEFFPESSGALFMQSPLENLMEIKVCWGNSLLRASVFPSEECWGLRRGRSHYWDAGATPGAKLNCRHAADLEAGAYLCIPLCAQGETLGLLYFQVSPDVSMEEKDFFGEPGAAFNETQIQLAESIAEHVSLSLVLPEASQEILEKRAESLRAGIEIIQVPSGGKMIGGLSISIGLALFPDHGLSPEALLQAADAALYRAKKGGRNRVEIAARFDPGS